MSKKYDVVATLGTYEKNGEKKYVTRNVGAVISTQHGFRLKLDASFNPAGCVRTEDGSVWLALFEPKEREAPQPQRQAPQQAQTGGYDDFSDDIPF